MAQFFKNLGTDYVKSGEPPKKKQKAEYANQGNFS
jgi:hypothetical protein